MPDAKTEAQMAAGPYRWPTNDELAAAFPSQTLAQEMLAEKVREAEAAFAAGAEYVSLSDGRLRDRSHLFRRSKLESENYDRPRQKPTNRSQARFKPACSGGGSRLIGRIRWTRRGSPL